MKYLLVLTLILSSCSKSNNNRSPAVESEICYDYKDNLMKCKNNDKCYITDMSNSFKEEISCSKI